MYGNLREWYLARLRSEAGELSSRQASLTPLTKIDSDQKLLDILSQEELSKQLVPKLRPAPGPILLWLIILMISGVVDCILRGNIQLLLQDLAYSTIGILLCLPPPQAGATSLPLYLNSVSFFLVPCLVAGLLPPTRWVKFKDEIADPQLELLEGIDTLQEPGVRALRGIASGGVLITFVCALHYCLQERAAAFSILLAVQAWFTVCVTALFIAHGVVSIARAVRLRPLLQDTLTRVEEPKNAGTEEDVLSRSLVLLSTREKLIADCSSELIIAIDKKWKVLESNKASWNLLGYLPPELKCLTLPELSTSPETTLTLLGAIDPETNQNQWNVELCLVSKPGTLVDLAFSFEWSHRQQVFFAVATDISAEKRIERARSQFLSMISHDVRSPLLSVLMGLQSIAEGHYGEPTREIKDAAKRAERNSLRIIDMVGEIIDLERSGNSSPVPDLQDCSLTELVSKSCEQVFELAEHLEVKLTSEVSEIQIQCDRKRIVRTLVNLLTNAIKYSGRKSSVDVCASVEFGFLKIKIKDNGPGIPEHLQTAIFDQYYRASVSNPKETEDLPSSGLGLAICKVNVEAHGGTIGVRSKPGEGSTFWFTLPMRKPRTG